MNSIITSWDRCITLYVARLLLFWTESLDAYICTCEMKLYDTACIKFPLNTYKKKNLNESEFIWQVKIYLCTSILRNLDQVPSVKFKCITWF